jgi:hypothetical protein
MLIEPPLRWKRGAQNDPPLPLGLIVITLFLRRARAGAAVRADERIAKLEIATQGLVADVELVVWPPENPSMATRKKLVHLDIDPIPKRWCSVTDL